jgi:hypothetical protein
MNTDVETSLPCMQASHAAVSADVRVAAVFCHAPAYVGFCIGCCASVAVNMAHLTRWCVSACR